MSVDGDELGGVNIQYSELDAADWCFLRGVLAMALSSGVRVCHSTTSMCWFPAEASLAGSPGTSIDHIRSEMQEAECKYFGRLSA